MQLNPAEISDLLKAKIELRHKARDTYSRYGNLRY